jgi:hypothetical protein
VALAPVSGDSVGTSGYSIVGQFTTFQVNDNNTTTPIEQITARSDKYGVTFTFNVLKSTYDADGGAVLASEKTAQVDQIGAHDHVVGLRGGQDQDPNGHLYNYLFVTVGTDDLARTSEIQIRMDHLGDVAAFAAIDRAWTLLQDLGPTGTVTV